MDVERNARLKAIFLTACDLSASERERYLADASGDDDELRAEVEVLLARHSATPTSAATARLPRSGRLARGTVVAGRYRIEGVLGEGGMGFVYRATQLALRREVALKVLISGPSASEYAIARFEREAARVARLRHPNIVTVYDAGTEPGIGAFFAMELVSGRSLAEEIADRGRLPVAEAVELLRQVAEAVDAAHGAGIIHRDLKPANIMLERTGASVVAKVLDFGIAKLIDEATETHFEDTQTDARAEPSLTATGALVGTPLYMSPEQAQGLDVDERTDIWSLGVMLYELLAGAPPFPQLTMDEVFAAILEHEPEPLAEVAAGTPESVCRIVAKALRKDQGERFETAAVMAAAIASAGQELRIGSGIESAGSDLVTSPREVPASKAPPTNLGPDADQLIGREDEVRAVGAELRREEVRLVTLTGPGGAGKTRLARAAALELISEFEDGTFFIDLSAIRDPTLVASAIARELDAKESGGRSMAECLVEHLRGKHLLLVLDNFEQVVEAAPFVARLLDAAPRLKTLATSRAVLHVTAEREFSVPPLAVPSGDRLPSIEELGRCAAVALFVARAAAARRGFTLNERNAPAIAEICRRLDGLPLAIELAAARIKLLSPETLLARLGERLKMLAGGGRDLPERQQTMRGAIAWSFDLLEGPEQALLRRLAVFAGGCTLEAAEAVCGNDELEVLDGLGSLLDNSLLQQRDAAEGELRFLMLEVVREFAFEQLQARGEADVARQSHGGYFLQLAEEAAPELLGARAAAWLERLEAEHDNLRAALQWLLEQDADACLRLASAVRLLWSAHGHYTEGRRWLESAIERSRAAPDLVRARALAGAGNLARLQGDLAAAAGHFAESLRISRRTGDARQIGWASHGLGVVAQQQGDLPSARACLEESLASGREVKDDRMIGSAIVLLGEISREEGAWAEARALYEQALAHYRQAGSQANVSVALTNLGAVAYEAGDLAGAGTAYRDALVIEQALGNGLGISYCLEGLGAVAVGLGEWSRAARLGGAAEARREEAGAPLERLEQRLHDGWVERLRAALDPATLEREWARGRAMTPEEAEREARDGDDG